MPVARARLFDELTVQQLVEKLASKWNDDESGVLACLADLLDADSRQRGYEGIAFYYRHPLGMENEDGSVKYHPLKIPVDKDALVNVLFGIIENDDRKMEDKRLRVYADRDRLTTLQSLQRPYVWIDALPKSISTKVSLSDIFVNKFEITRFLLDNDLPIPQGWREATAPGDGLNQRARSKGGKKSRWDTGLQAFIDWLHSEITADGTPFTLSTVKQWLENNAGEYDPRETGIPDCDEVYFADGLVSWIDSQGAHKSRALRSLERYISRAKST